MAPPHDHRPALNLPMTAELVTSGRFPTPDMVRLTFTCVHPGCDAAQQLDVDVVPVFTLMAMHESTVHGATPPAVPKLTTIDGSPLVHRNGNGKGKSHG